MSLHHLNHLLSETLVLGMLVFPVAVALAVLVGLISWILAGHEMGFRAAWITWCATMGVGPIVLRTAWGPDTRAICERCLTASRLRKPIQKERRRYPRFRVDLPATFSNEHTCGFGVIADVSAGGCRVTSQTRVVAGEFGQLLINVPNGIAPLTVSHALVRWVKGHEYGLEFIRMDPDDKGWLNRLIGQIGVGAFSPE